MIPEITNTAATSTCVCVCPSFHSNNKISGCFRDASKTWKPLQVQVQDSYTVNKNTYYFSIRTSVCFDILKSSTSEEPGRCNGTRLPFRRPRITTSVETKKVYINIENISRVKIWRTVTCYLREKQIEQTAQYVSTLKYIHILNIQLQVNKINTLGIKIMFLL